MSSECVCVSHLGEKRRGVFLSHPLLLVRFYLQDRNEDLPPTISAPTTPQRDLMEESFASDNFTVCTGLASLDMSHIELSDTLPINPPIIASYLISQTIFPKSSAVLQIIANNDWHRY